jgi:hypothetical protein
MLHDYSSILHCVTKITVYNQLDPSVNSTNISVPITELCVKSTFLSLPGQLVCPCVILRALKQPVQNTQTAAAVAAAAVAAAAAAADHLK